MDRDYPLYIRLVSLIARFAIATGAGFDKNDPAISIENLRRAGWITFSEARSLKASVRYGRELRKAGLSFGEVVSAEAGVRVNLTLIREKIRMWEIRTGSELPLMGDVEDYVC